MYAGGRDVSGSRWYELHRLDQLIDQLTRPSLPEAILSWRVEEQLRALGVAVGRSSRREDLIAELWGRKRPLMQQLRALDEPTRPCA
jgi:hypothetical protein